jgi:hypothetical protein
MTSIGPYYFFMKVGAGNRYLRQAIDTNMLWIGFADIKEIPSTPLSPLAQESPTTRVDRGYTDLLRLAGVSRHMRESCRVITFGEEYLTVWKITDEIRLLTPDEAKSAMQIATCDGDKVIRAEPIAQFERRSLLASIDSLAVYQFLNRGTFRPIFRCYPDAFMQAADAANEWLTRDTARLKPFWGAGETAYGAWVRLYLNTLTAELDPGWPTLPPHLSEDQIKSLVPYILSPAQIETTAMLFAQDLGLTVDIGVGKGLDAVDVKASARHRKGERYAVVKDALRICDEFALDLGIAVKRSLQETSTLSIQCKDYSQSERAPNAPILLFAPFGPTTPGTVTLQNLIRSSKLSSLPKLSDWVNLVV